MAGIQHKKQTYRELGDMYSVSASTIKRRLRAIKEEFECKDFPSSGVVLMDATYFGRNWGAVMMKDALSGKK